MKKVECNFIAKYGGIFHAPCTPFEVNDEDIDKLVKIGAKVLPQSPQETKAVSEQRDKKSARKTTPYKIPPAKKGE